MIQNEKITLRALEPDDIETLYRWENEMTLWKASNTLAPFSKHQLKQYIQHSRLDVFQIKQLRLIIELTATHQIVGMIDLFDYDPFHQRGGIGIMIHADFRQQGYASEALNLFTGYLFAHLGLHQVYASISIDNDASIALFKQAGLEQTGLRKAWRRQGREFVDELFFQKMNI